MFSRLQPIRESVRAADELATTDPDLDVLAYLDDMAEMVEAVVPDCVGLSVAWLDLGVSFTLVATDIETAALDAVQYLDGGPCVDATTGDRPLEAGSLLDEGRWQMFGLAAAARGIASTLTVPLVAESAEVVGTVNLYAATTDAFEAHHEVLAAIVGGHAADVVRNADLAFATLAASQQAPARLEAHAIVSQAAGILSARMDVGIEAALDALRRAANRAGVAVEDVARVVVEGLSQDPPT